MSQSHHTPDSGGNPESWISPQECSQMLMHAPVGVLKSTPEGKLLFANPALARMFGYSSETEMLEAVSDIARELYADPEDRQELLRLLQEQGQVVNYECPMLRKDGSRFWVSRNMQAVRDREGMVLHFFGFVSEITGRKRAEEALLQKSRELEERVKELDCLYGLSRLMDQTAVSSQELMQSVVELIPSGLHYPDIAYARLLLEDVTFKSPGFQETAWKHAADIVISGNKAGRIEVFYLQKVSGAEGSPFLREERQLIESVAERLGKTLEHIQNKEALQRNEEKFRSLVENADAIIYSQTPDGYLTYLSPRFTELLGYEVQDYIGRHVSDLLHPEDYPLAQRHLRDLFKTEQRQSKIEIRLLQKDGRWRWFTVNTSPQSYAHAKIESIMGVAHDITERKQAEEQLRESEERFRAIVEGAPDAMF
ncbi:MAG: PAS domain-containing protein, partial [Desulfohalobiaceae bacterium]